MKHLFLSNAGLAVMVRLTASDLLAAAADARKPPIASAFPSTPPAAIEPRVSEALARACTLPPSHQLVTYHAEITFDSVLPSLVKLQSAAALEVAIERPNRLAISYQSDLDARRLWYDGKILTVLDPPHRAYVSIAGPDSTDAMLVWARDQKNLTIPLAGFDYSDPGGRIRRRIHRSKYLSLNDVGGTDCDHLAFFGEEVDWQIWIEHDKKPLPRKIVITYKELPTEPHWQAIFQTGDSTSHPRAPSCSREFQATR
jgi:hypothetical protein